MPGHLCAEFDTRGWKRFRDIQVNETVPEGLLGVPLDSSVLEKCRPDLGDIQIITSTGSLVPSAVAGTQSDDDAAVQAVRIYKMSKKAGKWTDIWIDKSAKTLSRGVLIETSSRDFVRKVEIRGADNSTESYVVRLDGLIADLVGPVPIRCVSVFHQENNFRYLHVRIIDDDQPPLKLEGIGCHIPESEASHLSSVPVRVVESRQGAGDTILILDLGEKRFPFTKLTVHTPVSQFAKKVVVSAGPSLSSEPWEKIFDGTLFRVRRDESLAENLTIRTKRQTKRYFKMEFSGSDTRSLVIDKVEASGNIPVVVFNYNPGQAYRLYYENPKAELSRDTGGRLSFNPLHVGGTSSAIVLGREQINSEPGRPKEAQEPQEPIPSLIRKGAGVLVLLIGLLLLFSFMLRSVSRRRRTGRTVTRIVSRKV
ncbi:MAG: DUF3999 family protein [Deltaproteobacteria bacterium]|nr:DUF3999 family protein [Deltaproteobacteria bacterium]